MSKAKGISPRCSPDPGSPAVVQRKPGRPSEYNPEIAARICDRIAETNDTLRKICRDPNMPSRQTVGRWLNKQADFRRAYLIAAYGRIEDIAWECIEIADDASRDFTLEKTGGRPKLTVDKEHIARTEQRLRQRQWLCSKLAPKRFGDEP